MANGVTREEHLKRLTSLYRLFPKGKEEGQRESYFDEIGRTAQLATQGDAPVTPDVPTPPKKKKKGSTIYKETGIKGYDEDE